MIWWCLKRVLENKLQTPMDRHREYIRIIYNYLSKSVCMHIRSFCCHVDSTPTHSYARSRVEWPSPAPRPSYSLWWLYICVCVKIFWIFENRRMMSVVLFVILSHHFHWTDDIQIFTNSWFWFDDEVLKCEYMFWGFACWNIWPKEWK